jgi:hypothetical protein
VSATATVTGGSSARGLATVSGPSCSHAAGKVTCDLGNLKKGQTATVVMFFTAPAASFENCAIFTFKEQNTSLTTPNAACLKVEEVAATSPTDACGAGFTCKTDVSEIEHPPCPVNNPCLVVITFDKSFGTVYKLFYNGVRVLSCTTPGVASPDPCLVSRTLIPSTGRGLLTGSGYDTRFTILSAVDARLRGG